MKYLILPLTLLLAGCGGQYAPPPPGPTREPVAPEVTRFEDKEAGVVCWVYNGYNKGGISCLPIAQTTLGRER